MRHHCGRKFSGRMKVPRERVFKCPWTCLGDEQGADCPEVITPDDVRKTMNDGERKIRHHPVSLRWLRRRLSAATVQSEAIAKVETTMKDDDVTATVNALPTSSLKKTLISFSGAFLVLESRFAPLFVRIQKWACMQHASTGSLNITGLSKLT